jgi:hypothetical protein
MMKSVSMLRIWSTRNLASRPLISNDGWKTAGSAVVEAGTIVATLHGHRRGAQHEHEAPATLLMTALRLS